MLCFVLSNYKSVQFTHYQTQMPLITPSCFKKTSQKYKIEISFIHIIFNVWLFIIISNYLCWFYHILSYFCWKF